MRRHLGIGLALVWLGGMALRAEASVQPLLLGDGDRLLVLAPHPGDETLAAGGLIQEALALGLPVRVGFLTMGENNEIAFLFTRRHPLRTPGAERNLGHRRHREALAAADSLGLDPDQVVFLGYPDTAMLDIWLRHWRETPPYRSRYTRSASVAYDQALTPGSAHAGEDILDDLEEVLLEFKPTLLAVPHPADHNPDHRALDLFTRIALWNLESQGITPEVLAYPMHFTQWPEPRRYHPMSPALPPHFLRDEIEWQEFHLAPFQVTNKLAALRRHHSQYRHASSYLISFIRKTELFGAYPAILLPGSVGSYERRDEDSSRFRGDEELFRDLARESGDWLAIAEQNRAESAVLGDHDNAITRQTVSGDGSRLHLGFEFEQPLSSASSFHVHLFGYRTGTPFGEMPKVEIVIANGQLFSIRDLQSALPPDMIEWATPADDDITLRIPLDRLGSPDRILIGAHLSKDTLPADWLPWRTIDLRGEPGPAPVPPPPILTPRSEPKPPVPPPQAAPAPSPGRKPRPLPDPQGALTPRVRLPSRDIPVQTEPDEPVFW